MKGPIRQRYDQKNRVRKCDVAHTSIHTRAHSYTYTYIHALALFSE